MLASGALLVAVAGILIAMRSGDLPDFREYPAGPERRRLKLLDAKAEIGWFDRVWLNGLASDYGIGAQEMEPGGIVDALLPRVDIVPESLAQAAKESGWGTSRFAREGNNLFGEWCFDPGCGAVPNTRAFTSALTWPSSWTATRSADWLSSRKSGA